MLVETNGLAEWLDNNLIYTGKDPSHWLDRPLKTYIGEAQRNRDPKVPGTYINTDLYLYANYLLQGLSMILQQCCYRWLRSYKQKLIRLD
ncbi:MAG: hypothetical protein AB1489_38280, partial [Acidobacteriota bacterium]